MVCLGFLNVSCKSSEIQRGIDLANLRERCCTVRYFCVPRGIMRLKKYKKKKEVRDTLSPGPEFTQYFIY